ncbi:glycosyltransferase family 22 protein [Pisolithus croceorrhizus]|nr:glycosyltransferase family 22 protein [Pisolithus croceorrhizus]
MASQVLRLRRPAEAPKLAAPPKPRHTGILQDQLRRAARRPWNPDFSTAPGAMYSNIQDCDEGAYILLLPRHEHGDAFQTWEVTPTFAIRSWAYILLHLPIARLGAFLSSGKRPAFFAVRIGLAVISTLCEAKFCRIVVEKVNEHVGRYLFFMLLFNTGMWIASPALLPSSFVMYATTLAFAYALEPSSIQNYSRTLLVTLLFATGAIVGWPFGLALALPFVFEECFVFAGDTVPPTEYKRWIVTRWKHLFVAGLVSLLIFVPVVAIDSVAYGRWTIVPWNIVRYNIFGGARRGPDLYGTSPWHFYVMNLYVLVTRSPSPERSSPFTVLALRLIPLYLWIGTLSMQAHKEERFMYPVYPLLCFNAAVTLYLLRGWIGSSRMSASRNPHTRWASRSPLFGTMTLLVVATFEVFELPRLLNRTGLLPPVPAEADEREQPNVDLTPIKEFELRLCLGKEWHRFPGHYLVPSGIRVDFVKSDFAGLLPAHFQRPPSPWWDRLGSKHTPAGLNDLNQEAQEVPVDTCDYLVDLDFPRHPISSRQEPRYAIDANVWQRAVCIPFLDAAHSSRLTRALWLPGSWWQSKNEFGDYCLLRNEERVHEKERRVAARVQGINL